MRQEMKMRKQLLEALKKAMQLGVDLSNEGQAHLLHQLQGSMPGFHLGTILML